MIVSKSDVFDVCHILGNSNYLSLDTETTGIRPHHDSSVFSLVLANSGGAYYFNFNYNSPEPYLLDTRHIQPIKDLLSDKTKTWFMHNAKFDRIFLEKAGLPVHGKIHDTYVIARLEDNQHLKYSLDECSRRIGLSKSKEVDEYISLNKLYTKKEVPGKKTRDTQKHYDLVPFEIMAEYALQDASITYSLGVHQLKYIYKNRKKLRKCYKNELKLLEVVYQMEKRGVLIDKEFCENAIISENNKASEAVRRFEEKTKLKFVDSSKTLCEVFESDSSKWLFTEKGNASFDSGTLSTFENEAAKDILIYRESKSRANFLSSFTYYCDSHSVIHPTLNQAGTATGRFSSQAPNLQNITNTEGDFSVRSAFIPRPGYYFVMIDYDAMEYKMMLDHACMSVGHLTPLGEKVLSGLDVHQALADLVCSSGITITRSQAKTVNFAVLYGSGVETLSKSLGTSLEETKRIKKAIFEAAPEIERFINQVINEVKSKKEIHNWMGRRYYFPDTKFAYKAPNYLIQGGCADVVKKAMVACHNYLLNKKSKMILQIHDELIFEIHESENPTPILSYIMGKAYPFKYIPLTCSMEWSDISLAEKKEL